MTGLKIRGWVIQLLLLAGVIALFELTDIDLVVQDKFYRGAGHWLIDRHEPIMRFFFYSGPKAVLIGGGIACLVVWLLSYKRQDLLPFQRFAMLMALSLMLVPLCISGLKKLTNVYTPHQITRYDGSYPYVKVTESYPPDFVQTKRGRGWPAGHASGGFALMMLYFALTGKKQRVAGLILGLIAGWAMGLYQTFNGQHYLSHTIISMQISWLLICLIQQLITHQD